MPLRPLLVTVDKSQSMAPPSRVPDNSNSPLWVETDNFHIGVRMAPVPVVPNQPDTYPPWSAMVYIPSCSGMMRSPVWERSMNPSFKIITMCIYASGLATASMDSSNSHPTAGSPPSPTPSPVTEPTKPQFDDSSDTSGSTDANATQRVTQAGGYIRLVADGPASPSSTLVLLDGDTAEVIAYIGENVGLLEYSFGEHGFVLPNLRVWFNL